jgi:membrane glycosyltransferase
VPATLIDYVLRDRRWCQGNLQHTAVLLRAAGITLTNRTHFMIGIFSYLASPMWMVLILVGMALSLQNRFLKPEYFSDDRALVPSWPVIDPALALSVFFVTMAILLLPKLFGVIVAVVRKDVRQSLSPLQIVFGALFETLVSALVAPVLMVAQTSSVISILTGQDAGWTPQQRGSDGYKLKDVARRHAATTCLGVVLTLAALIISPIFAAWLAPATLGMMLAIPLSYFSGRIGPDFISDLLTIPEDRHPPACHLAAIEERADFEDMDVATTRTLIASGDERLLRADLVDTHWPLEDMEVHAPLAMAEAKLSRTLNADAYLKSLSRAEHMAVLNTPRVLEDMAKRLTPSTVSG